jgi:sterol desaturase/sphingolipid hydroxylase (fatty acid hydroxylase superfamily)
MNWMSFGNIAHWFLFVGAFLVIAIWESFQPGYPLNWPAERRWTGNGMILAISMIVQSVLLRTGPVALAVIISNQHRLLSGNSAPFFARFAASIILLDLTRYLTHRAFHSVSLLWRIHEVHHADPDYDVSTGARFHPLEVILTQLAYLAVVALLAPPPVAVFAADLITTAMNAFVHANIRLPHRLDVMLGRAIITPALHRIHHSEEIADQSRNFGQTFSFWDRLFGSYAEEGGKGEMLRMGIKELQTGDNLGVAYMLKQPFRRRDSA